MLSLRRFHTIHSYFIFLFIFSYLFEYLTLKISLPVLMNILQFQAALKNVLLCIVLVYRVTFTKTTTLCMRLFGSDGISPSDAEHISERFNQLSL